jgi:hypothetical protein
MLEPAGAGAGGSGPVVASSAPLSFWASFRQRVRIDPLNRQRIAWDYLVAVLALVVAFKVSFEVGFKVRQTPGLWAIDSLLDVVFCVDILIVLATKQQNEWGTERLDATRYFKGWFLVDLLSALPLDAATGILRLRLLKLLRLTRILRVFKQIVSANCK